MSKSVILSLLKRVAPNDLPETLIKVNKKERMLFNLILSF